MLREYTNIRTTRIQVTNKDHTRFWPEEGIVMFRVETHNNGYVVLKQSGTNHIYRLA